MGSRRLVGIAAGLAAAVAWSSAGLFIKRINLPGVEIAFLRSFFAAIFFAIAAKGSGSGWWLYTWESWAAAIGVGATVVLFVIATKWTTAAAAIFLQATAPAWVLVLGWFIWSRRPARHDLCAVACCAVGMTLFFAGHLAASGIAGNVVALVAGAFFGLHMVTMREVKERDRMTVLWAGNLIGVALAAAIGATGMTRAADGTGGAFIGPDTAQMTAIAYLGFGQIGLGYWLFTQAIARLPAIQVALLSLLEPILNPVWVYLGVGERPGPLALAGGAIVLGTVALHAILDQRPHGSGAVPGDAPAL